MEHLAPRDEGDPDWAVWADLYRGRRRRAMRSPKAPPRVPIHSVPDIDVAAAARSWFTTMASAVTSIFRPQHTKVPCEVFSAHSTA